MVACRYSNIPVANWLVSNGCNIDKKDKNGQTAFFRLITCRSTRIDCRWLGGYEGYEDLKELTLSYSEERFNYKIAKLLIDAGANVNVMDFNKLTPITCLIQQYINENDINIGVFLVRNGASLIIPNGKSILKKIPRLKKRLKEEHLIQKSCNIV